MGEASSITRAVSGRVRLAPAATQVYGEICPIARVVSVPTTVVETDLDDGYAPGARVAVRVELPETAGVIQVEAFPLSSVSTEQEEVPAQAESAALLLALQFTVAPATGITPPAATT